MPFKYFKMDNSVRSNHLINNKYQIYVHTFNSLCLLCDHYFFITTVTSTEIYKKHFIINTLHCWKNVKYCLLNALLSSPYCCCLLST